MGTLSSAGKDTTTKNVQQQQVGERVLLPAFSFLPSLSLHNGITNKKTMLSALNLFIIKMREGGEDSTDMIERKITKTMMGIILDARVGRKLEDLSQTCFKRLSSRRKQQYGGGIQIEQNTTMWFFVRGMSNH